MKKTYLKLNRKAGRLKLYKEMLKFFVQHPNEKIGFCGVLSELGYAYMIGYLNELQALRPKKYFGGTRYWWSPNSRKKRMNILKEAIKMTTPIRKFEHKDLNESIETDRQTISHTEFLKLIKKYADIRVGVKGGSWPFDYVYLKSIKKDLAEIVLEYKAQVVYSVMRNSIVDPALKDVLYVHCIQQTLV